MNKIIYFLIAVISLGSCTKIIEIELNSALQRIVIEGKITDQDSPVIVYISRTTDYFSPDEPEKITGAKVSIKGESGVYVNLEELSPGVYQTSLIKGENGQRYDLRVEDGEDVYEASSFLPEKVMIDSLVYEKSFFNNPRDTTTGYMLMCHYSDPADQANYYNFKVLKTPIDTVSHEFGPPGGGGKILFNDILTNGLPTVVNLNRQGLYHVGDTITVDLISLDQNIYNYFDQLNEISGGAMFGSSAPANPKNNISNGAMGYFSAEAIHQKMVIIE